MRSITLTLIIINAAVFFLAIPLIFFYPGALNHLAVTPSNIAQGKFLWTIFTSMFMHGGPFHLLANMISLMFLGGFLERIIGSKRFIAIYLTSGFMGALFFIILSLLFGSQGGFVSSLVGSPDIGAVGASGAIFGLAGMLAIMTPRLPVYIMFIPIAMPMWFGVFLIMFGLWAISAGAGLPVGNTAHLGGLITGVSYAIYLRVKYKKKADKISQYYR